MVWEVVDWIHLAQNIYIYICEYGNKGEGCTKGREFFTS